MRSICDHTVHDVSIVLSPPPHTPPKRETLEGAIPLSKIPIYSTVFTYTSKLPINVGARCAGGGRSPLANNLLERNVYFNTINQIASKFERAHFEVTSYPQLVTYCAIK